MNWSYCQTRGLLGLILEAMDDRKNHRGRPQLLCINQNIENLKCNSYREVKRKVNNRGMEIAANQ